MDPAAAEDAPVAKQGPSSLEPVGGCGLPLGARAWGQWQRLPMTQIRQQKEACYTDVENGVWGWVCRSSPTEKENCVLRCLSSECCDLIYGGDPLEEGDLDYVRGQEYKYCMHKCTEEGRGEKAHGKELNDLLGRRFTLWLREHLV